MLNRIRQWLGSSNRLLHALGGLIVGLTLGLRAALAAAAAMELKDVHHSHGNAKKPIRQWNWSSWDWLDILATAAGGLLGGAAQALIIYLIVS